MAAEKPKNVAIESSAHQAFKSVLGNSRELNGALSNVLRWVARQPPDIRSALFDGVSIETEADVMERIADAARVQAGRPSFRDAARLILQHAAETGPSSVLREMSFDEMSTLAKTLAELMAERGKLLQRELGDKVKSAQKK